MGNKVLEIRDKNGNQFRIKITTTSEIPGIKHAQIGKQFFTRGGWFGGVITGEWEALDKGFISVLSGKIRTRFSGNGDLTTSDLLILGTEGIKTYDGQDRFGIQLFEYEDFFGVNLKGEGVVIQPWVIALTPGRISWKSFEH